MRKCLDAGMDDCLLKPISLTTLSQRLAGIKPQGRQPWRRKPFDLNGLGAIVGADPKDRKRFLTALHQSLRTDLMILMDLPPEDAAAVADQAHKVLSAARLLEATQLMAACEALENIGLTTPQRQLRRQALARHMRRVEMALAGELAGTDERQSGRQPNAEAGRLRGDIT